MPDEVRVESTISGYKFSWDKEKIEVLISRLRNQRDGALKGGLKFVLGKSRKESATFNHNFSSKRERNSLIKDLTETYSDWKLETWGQVVDTLTGQVQKLWESGEPVIEIYSTDDVQPLDYLIYPIIPKGQPVAIFGEPGAGKSWLLLCLYITAVLPWIDNPLHLNASDKPSKILYLDYEASENDFRRVLKALAKGHDIGWIPMYYRRCWMPLVDDLDAIKEHIANIGADALFIDSTSLAAGGDLNRMDIATSYTRALRQLNMTSVSLCHTSKEDSKIKTIIGSNLFMAGFRLVWELRGQKDKSSLDLALYLRKTNITGDIPPLGYRMEFINDPPGQLSEMTIDWYDPRSVPEFVARMGNNTRILDALKEGGKTAKELVEELEITYQACHIALKRLAGKELVMKMPDGKRWCLPVI